MIKNCKKLLLTSLFSSFLLSSVQAADLEIFNNTSSEVTVVIEGGAGNIVKDKDAQTIVLKSGGTENKKIDKDTFGVDTFSVTGKVTIPSIDNACKLLMLDKDYKIIFADGKAGMITCKSVEK